MGCLTLLFQTMAHSIHLQSFEYLQQHGISCTSLLHLGTLKLTGWLKVMKKAFLSKSDPYLGLLDHCNTPTAATGMSPSLRLFGRQTKTLLSFSQSLLKYNKLVSDRLKKDRVKQAKYFEQHAKQLSELNPGETQWSQAVVSSKIAPRSYRVEANGKVYR